LNGLESIGLVLLQVILVLAIPIIIAEVTWAGLRFLAPDGFLRMPIFTASAKLLGLGVGILLLSSRYGRHYFDLHNIFGTDTAWDLSLRDFLALRANPFDYLAALVAHLDVDSLGLFGLGLIGLLLAIDLLLPFFYWPLPVAARAVAANLVIALMMAYLTVYFVCALMWTLYLLNFWTFAVVAIVFQYYRYRT
jgi:hypothetical protein